MEKRKKRKSESRKETRKGRGRQVALAVLVILVISIGIAVLRPSGTATVWFSSNGTGYACFLDNTVSGPRGGPLCLTDASNAFPNNATIPLGNYTIVFFATNIPQGENFNGFIASGGITVGNWAQYADPFSFTANMTVTGDGTLSVTWTQAVPVPEFPSVQILLPFTILILVGVVLCQRRKYSSKP